MAAEILKTGAVALASVMIENVAHWVVTAALAVAPPAAAAVGCAAVGVVGGAYIGYGLTHAALDVICHVFGVRMEDETKDGAAMVGALVGAVALGVICVLCPHVGAAVGVMLLVGLGIWAAWRLLDWAHRRLGGGHAKAD